MTFRGLQHWKSQFNINKALIKHVFFFYFICKVCFYEAWGEIMLFCKLPNPAPSLGSLSPLWWAAIPATSTRRPYIAVQKLYIFTGLTHYVNLYFIFYSPSAWSEGANFILKQHWVVKKSKILSEKRKECFFVDFYFQQNVRRKKI